MDAFITLLFTLDLCVNLFANSANYFHDFFTNPACLFDLVIVLSALIGLYLEYIGITLPPVKMIRVIRVLKVLPMIQQLAGLNRLVQSIGFCIKPMSQAFGIMFVVTLLYCVFAVHFFKERVPEYFADLSTALLSLHQVVTGDSWSSGITRSIFTPDENGVIRTDPAVALFFISYILVGNVLLLNCVVAVLLDEFLANVQRGKDRAAELAQAEAEKQRITGVLDPITHTLTSYQDLQDLLEKVDAVYEHIDTAKSGGLHFEQFRDGIKTLGQGIHMTEDGKPPPPPLFPYTQTAQTNKNKPG